ncbi:hypothetical protein P692DRAFT_20685966, partial [Suillus brevipes Sb2]
SYFLQCEPVTANHAVIMTVEDEEDEPMVEALAVTRSKSKAASHSEKGSVSIPAPPPSHSVSIPAPSDSTKPAIIEPKKEPAFRYESKATSPNAAKRLYEAILNTPIQHITISDLLSISPDLRKEAVEHSRTHRVP